ncbi:MAG: hypothetical protein ACFFBP_09575 [Promethearchaeota archaeon]
MKDQQLKVFKILYSGEIEEVINTKLIDLFSLLNVLAFYSQEKKKLYIWVGSHASRTIKNYIVKLRQIFTNDYPEYRVLRYITIESKAEPFEFFENTGISKRSLQKKIYSEESKYEEHENVINQIKDLKDKADTYFEMENYEQAIIISKEIINKAKEINEKLLIRDQIEFISEAEARAKAKVALNDIRMEKKILKNKFENIRQSSDIINIYNEACIFEQKYLEYLDLTALSDAKALINNIKYSYKTFNDEYEKLENFNAFLEDINVLRFKAKEALKQREFQESIKKFKEILIILNNRN